MALAITTMILDGNLIVFHIWLRCEGMTTFEFIKSKRLPKQDSPSELLIIGGFETTKEPAGHTKDQEPDGTLSP